MGGGGWGDRGHPVDVPMILALSYLLNIICTGTHGSQ